MTAFNGLWAVAEEVFRDLLPGVAETKAALLYLDGYGPIRSRKTKERRPTVETRIWREGDVGWLADIIETAWSRWLSVYPGEWRTVGQAIPYVHLQRKWECGRPKTDLDLWCEGHEFQALCDASQEALRDWESGGRTTPEPKWPPPYELGHTHGHDHGICIDPWLAESDADDVSITSVHMHELAHAIAGTFGHEDEWVEMCKVIGHELSPNERELELEIGNEPEAKAEEPCEQLVVWLET